MRRALLTAPHSLEWEARPTPVPRPGEVLVNIRAALTCGTDLKTYRGGHAKLGYGPFGHEASGDVMAVGEGVQTWKAGDAVMWAQTAPCGDCDRCLDGRENLCEHLLTDIALGAYADNIILPAKIVTRNLFLKPASLTYIEAAFLEPLACIVHGWNLLKRSTSSLVEMRPLAIVGAGTIGLLHLCYAIAAGLPASLVARSAQRLEMAKSLGAEEVLDESEAAAASFSTVIECAGTPQAWRRALGLARPGGRVLFFSGLPAGTQIELDATRIHYDEIACLGSFHFSPADVREAHALLAGRAIDVSALISGVEPLSSLPHIFERLDRRDGYKYALIPEPALARWV